MPKSLTEKDITTQDYRGLLSMRLLTPICMQTKVLILAFLLAYFGAQVLSSRPVYAAETQLDLSCLDGIGKTFDGITSRHNVEFCKDYHPGWFFEILPKTGYNGILTNGSALRLFNFRQPNWKPGQENTLQLNLVPYKANVFKLHLKDGDKIYDRNGKRTYFLWGKDLRSTMSIPGPYGGKWNPVRFFRCLTLAGYGCVTYYDVILCPQYRFPLYPRYPLVTVEPIIVVSTITKEDSEDLLEHFNQANALIEEALQRLLVHSCKQKN